MKTRMRLRLATAFLVIGGILFLVTALHQVLVNSQLTQAQALLYYKYQWIGVVVCLSASYWLFNLAETG